MNFRGVTELAFLAVAAVLFCVGQASAALKVSLITVSPGPVVFESFGHSALLLEDTEAPHAVLYEYGAVDTNKIATAANPLPAFVELFNSKMKTRASRTVISAMPPNNASSFPLILRNRYLTRPDVNREVIISALNLTEDQAKTLLDLIEKDFAAGEYLYDNYKNNCATRIRDRLFDDAVLGQGPRNALDLKGTFSIEELVLESFDAAVTSSTATPKTVSLLPAAHAKRPQVRNALMMLSFLGMSSEFASSKEFKSSLLRADETLTAYATTENVELTNLKNAFHSYFFSPSLTQKSITEGQSMFLPSKLRASLLKTVNPATGRPVIESEIKRTSIEERAATAAPTSPPSDTESAR